MPSKARRDAAPQGLVAERGSNHRGGPGMGIFKLGRYAALVAVMTLFLGGIGALLALNYVFASRAADNMAAVRAISQEQLQPRVIAAQAQIVRYDLNARRYLGRGLTELKG